MTPWLALVVSAAPGVRAADAPAPSEMRVIVNASTRVAGYAPFWNGTGMNGTGRMMPFYEAPIVRATVAMIDAVPFDGCVWNRPHNLLRYVRVRGLDSDAPQFDFRDFDAAIDPMVQAGQRLWFEFRGIAKGAEAFLVDFREESQQTLWRKVVKAAISHLVARRCAGTARSWYFEG